MSDPAKVSENPSPPTPIKAAAYLAGASFYFGLVMIELTATLGRPAREIVVTALGVVVFLFLQSLYRGRNWARIILLILYSLSFLGVNAVLRKEGFDFWRAIVQMTAQVVVVVLLFQGSSNAWFKRPA